MKYFVVVFICVASTIYCSANASPSSINSNLGHDEPRYRREIPDECRMPHFHRPPHHRDSNDDSSHENVTPPPPPPVCCDLPDFMMTLSEPEVFGRCHRFVHETLNPGGGSRSHHRHHSSKPASNSDRIARDVAENGDNKEAAQVDKFQEKKECFMYCVFNSTGLMTNDAFNEELLMKKLSEAVGNDTKWSSIFDPAYKKCLAAAKEANSQSQKTCKAGPAEYMKCFTREFFFNCPSDVWTNSQECTEFKQKLEKCPNLMPFPPHRPHGPPHHHHHHHHNHHKHHRKPSHSDENQEEP